MGPKLKFNLFVDTDLGNESYSTYLNSILRDGSSSSSTATNAMTLREIANLKANERANAIRKLLRNRLVEARQRDEQTQEISTLRDIESDINRVNAALEEIQCEIASLISPGRKVLLQQVMRGVIHTVNENIADTTGMNYIII